MSNFSSLSAAQFRRAADIQEQIEALNGQLADVLGGNGVAKMTDAASVHGSPSVKTRKKYKLSAEGRAKKVAAQKARWAKAVASAEPASSDQTEPSKKRKKMSVASKAKIAAAAKARWAKVKAAKEAKAS